MDAEIITGIIDKHLQKWMDFGLNKTSGKIDAEMSDREGEDEEGYTTWYPIGSTVTTKQVEEIETNLGHFLPPSYVVFLKHKHFYQFYIDEARFENQTITGWKTNLIKKAFHSWPMELLIDKGYLPFASWSDWGELCFDTNQAVTDNEYPVILWDHDDWTKYQSFSENFQQLLEKLDRLSEADGILNNITD